MRLFQRRLRLFAGLSVGVLAGSPVLADLVPGHNPIGVRVRIAEAVPHVLVRGFDLRVYDTQKWGQNLVASADKTSEWEFRCQASLNDPSKKTIRAVQLSPPGKRTVLELREPVSVHSPVGFLHYGNSPYRDELRIYSTGLLCEVINEVDLEKYLDGLVNSEFSAKWNEESIAAQVVAARTYAYHQILEAKDEKIRKSAHYDVDATVKDQVYNGSMKEDFHSSRIVTRTRGLVLTQGPDESPVPMKAFYHSTCGGITELPEHVWGKTFPGFKKPVVCPYCAESPRYRWSLDLSTSELVRLILAGARAEAKQEGLLEGWPKNANEILATGKLLDLRISELNGERRVLKVTTSWADNQSVKELTIPGPRFRDWVGVSRLRSTSFSVFFHKVDGLNSWHFEGQGNGHGVGMCQWGAKVMGEKGFKMESILKYYYPDAILRKLW